MTSKVGIAIVGGGIFAREQHLPAVVSCDTLELKAVYSRTHSTVDIFLQDVQKHTTNSNTIRGYYDVDDNTPSQTHPPPSSSSSSQSHGLDALLSRVDIHAVIIALPILLQPEVILKCLKAGKHVLSEKPLAGDVQDGVKLIGEYSKLRSSQSSAPIFSIAENYRYEPVFQYAAEVVSSGRIGKLTFFTVQMYTNVDAGNKYYQTSWRKQAQHQGGFLLDGGVHFAAALRFVVGVPVESVSAFSRLNKEILAPIDTLHATLKLVDGTTGIFGASFASTKTTKNLTVVGEKGTVVIKATTPAGYKVTVTIDNKPEEKIFAYEGVKREVAAFGAAIKASGAESIASAAEALLDVALIESMIESAEKGGQPVHVPTLETLQIPHNVL